MTDSGRPGTAAPTYHIMDCERCLWSYLGEQRGEGISLVIPPIDSLANLKF